ncbi:MAG: Fic family protein [Halanaerobiales bacterium]|nr:Fic family protein [Halanaerobiales bacterium]
MTNSFKYGSDNSKYCYPGTNILINKLDIKDEELLRKANSLYSAQRLLELQAEPLSGNYDLQHLKNIHHYIFQDLYEFAGKIREEDIIKGNTLFAKSEFIESKANQLFKELKKENYLKGTKNITQFAQRISYYMAELNIIHPFRDGNGRTIREFIRCLALNSSYILNWNSINKDELLNASIKSVININPLYKCIEKAIEKKS